MCTSTLPGKPAVETYRVGVGYGYAGHQRASETVTRGTTVTEKTYVYAEGDPRLERVDEAVGGTATRSTGYSYDSHGSVTSITGGGKDRTLTYTNRDELARVIEGGSLLAEYTYDAGGRRVFASDGTYGASEFVYAGDELVEEIAQGGGALKAHYSYGNGPLAVRSPDKGMQYLHTDLLGSTSALTGASGAPVGQYEVDPWGQVRSGPADGATANRLVFTGHQHDATGFDYFGARYYDAASARFLSRDPFPGTPGIPASLNPYSYAYGNPGRYVDPDGRAVAPVAMALVVGIVFTYNMLDPEPAANGELNPFGQQYTRKGAMTRALQSALIAMPSAMGGLSGARLAAGMALEGAAGGIAMQGASDFDHERLSSGWEYAQSAGIGAALGGGLYGVGRGLGAGVGRAASLSRRVMGRTAVLSEATDGSLIGARKLLGEPGSAAISPLEQEALGLGATAARELPVAGQAAPEAAEALERLAMRELGAGESAAGRKAMQEASAASPEEELLQVICEIKCFVAGTPVHTESGLRPIESVAKGEKVLAADPETGEVGYREVTRTFEHAEREVIELQLSTPGGDTERVKVTPEHPFWVAGKGWTQAKELEIGTALTMASELLAATSTDDARRPTSELLASAVSERGPPEVTVEVTGLTALPERTTVYNLEVAGVHTYFVGTRGVLVHNSCCETAGFSQVAPPRQSFGQLWGPRDIEGVPVRRYPGHEWSPRDPGMWEPRIVARGPFTTVQRNAMRAGESGGTKLAPHHRHQLPVDRGGVIDEIPGPGHPAGNIHTAGRPTRHPGASWFRNFHPQGKAAGEAQRLAEIVAHWRAKGARLVPHPTRPGLWIDPGD